LRHHFAKAGPAEAYVNGSNYCGCVEVRHGVGYTGKLSRFMLAAKLSYFARKIFAA
jgi:hypothetical protein